MWRTRLPETGRRLKAYLMRTILAREMAGIASEPPGQTHPGREAGPQSLSVGTP